MSRIKDDNNAQCIPLLRINGTRQYFTRENYIWKVKSLTEGPISNALCIPLFRLTFGWNERQRNQSS